MSVLKLSLKQSGKSPFAGVIVEYDEKVIEFKGSGRVNCGTIYDDLFSSFNEYIGHMEDDRKSQLWDLYVKAKTVLDPTYFDPDNADEELMLNNRDYHFLTQKLKPIIADIFELLKMVNYEYFITQSGYVDPPRDLTSMTGLGEYPSETTISGEDYRHLAALVLGLRGPLPIIAEMIYKNEITSGKSYKEVVAGDLIKDVEWIKSHIGWRRLNEYITYTYNTKGRGANGLNTEIISNDRFSNHVVYRALFGRLCLSHVPSKDPRKNLVKSLFSIVNQSDKVPSSVREKKGGGKDENNDRRGFYEIYQLKEEHNSTDEAAQSEYFTFSMFDSDDNPTFKNWFNYQCKGLGINDPLRAEKLYELIPDSWEFEPRQHIVKLCQLAFAEDISYNIYYALDYTQLTVAVVLAQMKLHQMGYPNLALLLTTVDDPEGERINADVIFSLNQSERNRLEALCDVVKGDGLTSSSNEAVAAALEFFKELGNGCWQSTIELGLIDDDQALNTAPRGCLYEVMLGIEIKEEFIKLCEEVNSFQ